MLIIKLLLTIIFLTLTVAAVIIIIAVEVAVSAEGAFFVLSNIIGIIGIGY